MYKLSAYFFASELEAMIEDHYEISVDLNKIFGSERNEELVSTYLHSSPLKPEGYKVEPSKRLVQDYLRKLLPDNVELAVINLSI